MKKRKALIFDSSSIISLAMNGLLDVLTGLSKESKIEFFITPNVRKEIVEDPLKTKKFELEALQIKDLIEKGVIALADDPNLEKETQNFLNAANSAFTSMGERIKLLHGGEASCFALAKIMKDYDSALVIDERTARILSENPENLRELLEKKMHREIDMDEQSASLFSGFKIIRSAELAVMAYKKGIIDLPAQPKQIVDALLYGVKLNGCSISSEEIEEAKKLFK